MLGGPNDFDLVDKKKNPILINSKVVLFSVRNNKTANLKLSFQEFHLDIFLCPKI